MLREILIGVSLVLLVSAGVVGYIFWKAMQETVTPIRRLNPTSSGPRALVVYSPGVSDFHEKVTEAFTSGLVASGWSVDTVTASHEATTDYTGYSLLVIGGPIHGAKPSKPVLDYMDRVPQLAGLRVYTIITSAGGPPQGEALMAEWAKGRGGEAVGVLSLSTSKNAPVDDATDPAQIAAKAAQKIPR